MDIHPLVDYLLQQDKRKEKWFDLAVKFKIGEGKSRKKRTDDAHNTWKGFLRKLKRKDLDLEVVKQTYKKGELLYETRKKPVRKQEVDTSDLEVVKVTTNPHGGEWVTYAKQAGVSEAQVIDLQNTFNFSPYKPTISTEGSGVGCVDISDIHTGAMVKVMHEVFKQQEFNLEVLQSYLDNAAHVINSYNFEEVHLFIPGDIIESFSGFNHTDTYKNLQAHQGELIIIAFEVIKRLCSNIVNLKEVYMVEGNHDRFTAIKPGNSRKGVVEVVAHFLNEAGLTVNYHPFIVTAEIDGIWHICTHGDFRPFDKKNEGGYGAFFYKYGKQGMYNVLKTGHLHRFNILAQTPEYLHYECPSLFTGGFFEESIGFYSLAAMSIVRNFNGIARIDYVPLQHDRKD